MQRNAYVTGVILFLLGISVAVLSLKLLQADRPVAVGPAVLNNITNTKSTPSVVLAKAGKPVNLGLHYSCSTSNAIAMGGIRNHPNNLDSFPSGLSIFDGINFQVEGVIQLGSGYPPIAEGIAVGSKARRIHLLHGTGSYAVDGTEIATLVVHYETGFPVELPIQYGIHVRDWWIWRTNESRLVGPGTSVAWLGENNFSRRENLQIRVYHSIFENPHPDALINTITYTRASKAGRTTPFLLGLTVE